MSDDKIKSNLPVPAVGGGRQVATGLSDTSYRAAEELSNAIFMGKTGVPVLDLLPCGSCGVTWVGEGQEKQFAVQITYHADAAILFLKAKQLLVRQGLEAPRLDYILPQTINDIPLVYRMGGEVTLLGPFDPPLSYSVPDPDEDMKPGPIEAYERPRIAKLANCLKKLIG